jgi:hypothetical protein
MTYTPYIYACPFVIKDKAASVSDIDASLSARQASAAIIYNLALVDHLHNRYSRQAISLYELATSLLVDEPVDMLGIALINNIGVWCYETGDVSAAQRCMEHLTFLLPTVSGRESSPAGLPETNRCMSEQDHAALLSNISHVLNPPFSVSPAA